MRVSIPSVGGRGLIRLWLATALVAILVLACTSAPVPTPSPIPTTQQTEQPSSAPTAQPELYDFGDAPDPSYPSLLASDGARSRDITQFWLGNLRSPSVTSEYEAVLVNRDELDDGLEAYVPLGANTTYAFRAVKAGTAAGGIVYFNLLVDLDRDGRWQGDDWVVRNLEIELSPGEQELIESSVATAHNTWIRATLTDSLAPIGGSSAAWEGTGEFAVGEVEDYYFPAPTLTPPPPSEPPYTPPPTESPTPTPSPTPERTIVTGTPGPSAPPSPTVVYTGDFEVECRPLWTYIVHGESATFALNILSGKHTPPERFRVQLAGGEEGVGGTVGTDPPAGDDGWSAWADGASLTFTSTHVDPPPRLERQTLIVTLQSRSTTRFVTCVVDVGHFEPSPPTQHTPNIRVEPEIVTLSQTGQAAVTISGSGFTSGGRVLLTVFPPNGFSFVHYEQAGETGQLSLSLHLQPGLLQPSVPRGTWHVSAIDSATDRVAETTFTVR